MFTNSELKKQMIISCEISNYPETQFFFFLIFLRFMKFIHAYFGTFVFNIFLILFLT